MAPTTVEDGHAWIAGQPAELHGQMRIVRGLLDLCATDPDARWFALSCSLARGAGDALSDVDCGIGVAEGTVEAVTARIADLDLGARIDTLVQHWLGSRPTRRIFVQFTDGTQLDLVVMPVVEGEAVGRAPDEVVLYDRDGTLASVRTPEPDRVDGGKVREWTFLAWVALADLAKYLDRGSLWEAHARLAEARDRVWALWGALRGARYPVFGLSQVLDHDPTDLPPGVERTVAGLDPVALRTAARDCAAVLTEVSAAAAGRYPTPLPTDLAAHVAGRLG
jgi:hypothetical protein